VAGGRIGGGKLKRGLLISVVLVAVILATSAYILYPRRSLQVYLLYHEAIGGGGVGGIIDVNLMVKNTGNRKAGYVEGYLSVVGEGGEEVLRLNISFWDLAPGDVDEAQGYFVGDQFRSYRIEVSLTYSIGEKEGSVMKVLQISEDYMNVISSFTLKC